MLLDVLRDSNLDIIDAIVYIISAITVIFLTMPVHEFAHAFAAYKLGDHSQKYAGRLTINPFAHIDWFGALCILLVGFGWARPVQVNSYNLKNGKRDMAITAFAGPLANLIVAFISVFLFNFVLFLSASFNFSGIYIALFFGYIAQINVSLAVFNLVPVPPLDGSKLLFAVLPDKLYYKFMQYERYIYFILLLLVFTGFLSTPISYVSRLILNLFSKITAVPFEFFI